MTPICQCHMGTAHGQVFLISSIVWSHRFRPSPSWLVVTAVGRNCYSPVKCTHNLWFTRGNNISSFHDFFLDFSFHQCGMLPSWFIIVHFNIAIHIRGFNNFKAKFDAVKYKVTIRVVDQFMLPCSDVESGGKGRGSGLSSGRCDPHP